MMCTDFTTQLLGIYSILLAPHGVIAHACPPKSVPVGFDLTSSPTYTSSFEAMFATGKPVVAGPTRMVTVKGGISLTAWYPLFVNGSSVPRTKDTFWGVGGVIVELTRLLATKKIKPRMAADGLEYAMWWTEYDAANGTYSETVIETSAAEPSELRLTMDEGLRITLPVSQPGKVTYLAMYPKGGPLLPTMSTNEIVTIALVVFFGASLVVVALLLVLYSTCSASGTATRRRTTR